MARTVTIRQRLLRDLIVMIVAMGGLIVATTFIGSRRAVQKVSASLARQTLDTVSMEMQRFFEPVVHELRETRLWIQQNQFDLSIDPNAPAHEAAAREQTIRERLNQRLIPLLTEYRQISSILVADDEGHEYMLLRREEEFEVWQTRPGENGATSRTLSWASDEPAMQEQTRSYDPRSRPWFDLAISRYDAEALRDAPIEIAWTDPYLFFTTQELGITASVAHAVPGGKMQVIAADILLRDISKFSQRLRVGRNGGVMVLSADQRVLGLPRIHPFKKKKAEQRAYLKRPDELRWALAVDASNAFLGEDSLGETVRFISEGEPWWGDGQWFDLSSRDRIWVGVVMPEDELLGGVLVQRIILVAIVLVLLALGVWRAIFLARRFSQPVEALVLQSDRISRGDFEPGDPIESDVAEIRTLAKAQDRMRDGLRSLMKLERDLQIARQIQQSTLPGALPAIPSFDIAAWNEPADETGGDVYDFIAVTASSDDRRRDGERFIKSAAEETVVDAAVLMLADATGHGIGPALSVSDLRAMLRMALRGGTTFEDLIRHLNEQLHADLPTGRFITAWLSCVDARSGTVLRFSAGQAPILIYRAAEDTFEVEHSDAPPLAVLPDIETIVQEPLVLAAGDLVVVASDGIFEAMNPEHKQFGKDRVMAVLRENRHEPAEHMIRMLKTKVDEFCAGEPMGDDQTLLIIKRTR